MYKDLIKKILLFSKSIVFKLDILADSINTRLESAGYTVDYEDKSTWKYYLNMCGEMHVSNTKIYIKAIETSELIELTKENLDLFGYTRAELKKSDTYYKEIIANNITQIEYIKGCISPVNMDDALEADEGVILAYNDYFIEKNEYNIIPGIEKYIIKMLYRWKIDAYSKYENLYVPTLLGVLYNNIPSLVLNLRLRNINTPFVHSYLINEYFSSNGISKEVSYLNNVSKFWLYRNLDFIKHNIGKDKTLKLLVDNVLTPNSIGIARLKVSEKIKLANTGHDKDNLNRSIIVTPEVLNNAYDKSEMGMTISEILESELVEVDPLSGLTNEYLDNFEHEYNNVAATINTLKEHSETTKVLYITPEKIFDFFNNRLELIISNWVYMLKNDLFYTVAEYNDPNSGTSTGNKKRLGTEEEYVDPNTSKTYTLNSYTGFLVLMKLLLTLVGKENMTLTKINYYNVIPRKSTELGFMKLFDDGFSNMLIEELNNDVPTYPEKITMVDNFKDYIVKYFNYIKKARIVAVNTSNTFIHTNLSIFFENLVEHDYMSLEGTVDELLHKENVDFVVTGSFDVVSSIRSIIKTFTGISDDYYLNSLELDGFKSLINKLTAYTTQVINNSESIDNTVYLPVTNPKQVLSKKALFSILDTKVNPLEKLDAELNSYMFDFYSGMAVGINQSAPRVSMKKDTTGVFVNYKGNYLANNIPVNIISLRNAKDYDILNDEFKNVFIKSVSIDVVGLEPLSRDLDTSANLAATHLYNYDKNTSTYFKPEMDLSSSTASNDIEIKPRNIVSIENSTDYKITDKDFIVPSGTLRTADGKPVYDRNNNFIIVTEKED